MLSGAFYTFCILSEVVPLLNAQEIVTPSNFNNDTEIEQQFQCHCVLYFQCKNNYIVTDGADLFDVRFKGDEEETTSTSPPVIPCTSNDRICCKLKPSQNETVDNVETKHTHELFQTKPNRTCGISRAHFDVRFMTPEDEYLDTIKGEIPWIVNIYKKDFFDENCYNFKCTGSLIAPNVVLTANHCLVSVHAVQLKVVASGNELYEDLKASSQDARAVSKIVKHPRYKSGTLQNDIALLLLDRPYDHNVSLTNTICLPDHENQVFDGKRCFAVGWGRHRIPGETGLRKVDLPIVPFKRCQEMLRKTRLGSEFTLKSSFLCAGGEAGKDTCAGDGGGPLFCPSDYDQNSVQVGIVSWGVDCGQPGIPGLYTDLAKFKPWIDEKIKAYSKYIDK